jgi:hypothetical protein
MKDKSPFKTFETLGYLCLEVKSKILTSSTFKGLLELHIIEIKDYVLKIEPNIFENLINLKKRSVNIKSFEILCENASVEEIFSGLENLEEFEIKVDE